MPELPVVGDAPSKAAGGAKNVLTKKVGPLPVWGYAVALGAGLLALRLVHGGGASSTAGGVGDVSSGSAGAGGNPAGSGANLVPPADTGPRQSPVGADTSSPIPTIINNYYPIGGGGGGSYSAPATGFNPNAGFGGFYSAPIDNSPTSLGARTIPSVPSLQPTAPVQPPAPGFPTGATLVTINGVTYSLSDAVVAAGGLPFAGGKVSNANPPAPMAPAPVSSPTGPSVPSAPVQPPAPGSRFEG